MDKREIYAYLQERQVPFEITEHPAVFNMAELAAIPCPHPDADAKNLFVRDDKRRNYYLITVKGEKRVDLKAFRKRNQTRQLTFASAEELHDLLHVYPGAVTPFGLLNDPACRVQAFIDQDLLQGEGLVGVHPNDNTATVWLKTETLITLLRAHGNRVEVVEI